MQHVIKSYKALNMLQVKALTENSYSKQNYTSYFKAVMKITFYILSFKACE